MGVSRGIPLCSLSLSFSGLAQQSDGAKGERILQIRDEIVTSLWLAPTYHHRPSSPEKICVMPFVPGDPPLLLYFAKEKR